MSKLVKLSLMGFLMGLFILYEYFTIRLSVLP